MLGIRYIFSDMRTRSRALAAVAVAAATGAALAGCGDPLPSSQRIASTRVLAIKAEVTTPLFPESDPDAAVRCQALPFEGVRLTPFIVDPSGPIDPLTIEPVYIACNLQAIQGLFACLKGAVPTDFASLPVCPAPSFADLDPMADSLPEPPSPCVLAPDASDDGLQDLTIPFATSLLAGGDVEVTMIGHAPGGPSTRECADALLSGETDVPNDCIYAVQRVSVGPIEQLLSLVAMFGVELPPEFGEPPDPEDIPDGDRNPRIESFAAVILHPDGSTEEIADLARGDTITAAADDIIQLTTVAPEGDLQFFPVAVNNGEDYEERQEDYSGRWFVSWGSLLSGISDDPVSYNEWELRPREDQEEPERPEGDVATLFYVLRDGRQGVDWWWLNLALTPASE
ncbi:MAG: hypothetical protein KC486_34050 [Myxococcales bacterium]|nr:hypothetical protein [Myxococcales bacterium]